MSSFAANRRSARFAACALVLLGALTLPAAAAPKKTGTITVRSPVEGAVVSVDGKEMGALPLPPLTVPFGNKKVRILKPGLIDHTQQVTLRPGEQLVIEAVPSKTASLLTVQAARGVEVLLDGKSIGKTPVRGFVISPGSHNIVMRGEGLQPYREDFKIAPWREHTTKPLIKRRDGKPLMDDSGDALSLDLALEPMAPTPAGGGLDLDLALLAPDPVAPGPARPGGATTGPSAASGPAATTTIVATRADVAPPPPAQGFTAAPVEPEPPPGPAFYTRGWFWGAVAGAAVVAAAVPVALGKTGGYVEQRNPGAWCTAEKPCLLVINK